MVLGGECGQQAYMSKVPLQARPGGEGSKGRQRCLLPVPSPRLLPSGGGEERGREYRFVKEVDSSPIPPIEPNGCSQLPSPFISSSMNHPICEKSAPWTSHPYCFPPGLDRLAVLPMPSYLPSPTCTTCIHPSPSPSTDN